MEGSASKRCSRCKADKPCGAFARKDVRRLQPYCRPCQAEYHREHYRKNKKGYIAAAKRRMKRMLAIMSEAKRRPCADCLKEYPPYVMDFDHREDQEKVDVVNRLRYVSEETLRAEIAKCDVVCANCHRERTHRRKQNVPKRYRDGAPKDENRALE